MTLHDDFMTHSGGRMTLHDDCMTHSGGRMTLHEDCMTHGTLEEGWAAPYAPRSYQQ